ncbi:hypothetical protein DPV78_001185 [Talaromyces pinophilus]|nr:hypothetical protein DPV78_001185 [Talaromyces pinophilus]
MSRESNILPSILRDFGTPIFLLLLEINISTIQPVMDRQLPPAPPLCQALSSESEAVSIINHSTEETDEQTYKDLCNSRIDLLEKHYRILKDTLHKAMGVADMWWGADDVQNLEQQAELGTRLIDEILQPYAARTHALVNRHTGRFGIDETLRGYLNACAGSVTNCFTPGPGMDHRQAYAAKGLTVRLAEVLQIRKSISNLRKDYGRKIILEKGVRDYGFEHILKEPEEDPGTITWSLLWAGSTKPEDVKLWSIIPRVELQMHKRDAFEAIKDKRISLLGEKFETAKNFWNEKLGRVHDEDLPIESDNDDNWAEDFEDEYATDFVEFVDETKLRLMKEFNIFNFRFLGTLTNEVIFDEDRHLEAIRSIERREWAAFVEYRKQLLQVERTHAESLQFVDMDDVDE